MAQRPEHGRWIAPKVSRDLDRRHALGALLENNGRIEAHFAALEHALGLGQHDTFPLPLFEALAFELRHACEYGQLTPQRRWSYRTKVRPRI